MSDIAVDELTLWQIPDIIQEKYGQQSLTKDNKPLVLGEGSFGAIVKTIKNYAVKIIETEDIDFPERTAICDYCGPKNINSPYIIKIYEVILTKRYTYIIMELGQPLDIKELYPRLKPIFTQMCKAVADVHRAGMTHQDIKPANFVILEETVKLIDFGLLKPMATVQTTTLHENFDHAFAPPEFLLNQLQYQKSDVWGLGVILLSWLTPQIYNKVFPRDFDKRKMLSRIFNFLGWSVGSKLENIEMYQELKRDNYNPQPILANKSLTGDLSDPVAEDLLRQMLAVNPEHRISIYKVLQHPYFKDQDVPIGYITPVPIIDTLHKRSITEKVVLSNPNFYLKAIKLLLTYKSWDSRNDNYNIFSYAVTMFNYYTRIYDLQNEVELHNCAATCYMLGNFFYHNIIMPTGVLVDQDNLLDRTKMLEFLRHMNEVFAYDLILATSHDYIVNLLQESKQLQLLPQAEELLTAAYQDRNNYVLSFEQLAHTVYTQLV